MEDNNKESKVPTNFIRDIIDEDLRSGKHTKIHTRFPPEPNGYLHIGHTKSICLNFGLAKDYNGLCNLRFDDTNPTKEEMEYVDSIKKDIRWLGFDWEDREYFASDYFDQLYEYAIKLIKKAKSLCRFPQLRRNKRIPWYTNRTGKRKVLIGIDQLKKIWIFLKE